MNIPGDPMAQLPDASTSGLPASATKPREQHDKAPGKWELFIDFGLRGGMELKTYLGVSEQMFVHTAGQAAADSRAFVLYAALDEMQKAAVHLMRFQELLSDEDVPPLSAPESRLLHFAIIEELGARERRLVEVLVNLVLFSTTNEQPYYRHFLMLEELADMLRANDDLGEFQGVRSVNLDSLITRQASRIIQEQRHVDFARAWYLDGKKKPIPRRGAVDTKRRLRSHAQLLPRAVNVEQCPGHAAA
jgi:hypothetical protein